jgi:Spy/CpxP family protein refolding chaperone
LAKRERNFSQLQPSSWQKNSAAIAAERVMIVRKYKFSILIATAILGSLITAGIARAQGMMGPPPGGPMGGPPMGGPFGGPPPVPPPLMMALRAAALTPAQQKQIQDIVNASRTSSAPQMQQMHSIRDQIADKLLSSGSVSAADLAPLLAQQTAIQQQLDNQMVATAIQIRGVLTPDQLSKVASVNDRLKQIHTQIDSILGPPDAPPVP